MTNAIERLEAYMNGISMTSIHPGILVTNIQTPPPAMNISTNQLAGRNGERVESQKRTRAKTTISFVFPGSSIAERQLICQQVASWARQGILQVSNRQGQRLRCICTSPPSISDVMDRAEELKVELTAYSQPFWEENTASTTTLTGTSGNGTLYVPGNGGEVLVEITATPTSGTLNSLTLTVGGDTMSFTSLGATSANPFRLTYSDEGIQSIKVGNTSVLGKRSAASADDLRAASGGLNTISMTANVASSVVFSTRGVWL